jgi:hypothetical protein
METYPITQKSKQREKEIRKTILLNNNYSPNIMDKSPCKHCDTERFHNPQLKKMGYLYVYRTSYDKGNH